MMNYTLPANIPLGLPQADAPHARRALELFQNGCQCAQATFCAFEDVTGLPHDTCKALSASFGGGVARIRGGCGALSGMLMAAGLLLYPTFPKESAKDDHYRLTQYLCARFKERMSSIYCRDLMHLPGTVEEPISAKRTAQFYADRPCAHAVVIATEILDDVLQMQQRGELAEKLTDAACVVVTWWSSSE